MPAFWDLMARPEEPEHEDDALFDDEAEELQEFDAEFLDK